MFRRIVGAVCALALVTAGTATAVVLVSDDGSRDDELSTTSDLVDARSWVPALLQLPGLSRLSDLGAPASSPPAPLAAGPLAGTGDPLPTRVFGGETTAAPRAQADPPATTGPVRGRSPVSVPGSPTARGQAALRSLPYPWEELGVSVVFRPYTGASLGRYEPRLRRVTVFVSPSQSTQGLRVTLAHELAHALDDKVGTTASRRAYLVARGVSPSTPWLPCAGCGDFGVGAGDFAEVFALFVAGPGDFRSRLAGEPSSAALDRLAPFFRPPSERMVRRAPAPAPTPTRAPASAQPTPPPGLIDSLLGF